jgi:2-oxo-3-hexenedioate decarboxylase
LRAQGGRASAELGGFAEPRIEPEIVLHFQAAPPVTRDELAILDCIELILNLQEHHLRLLKLMGTDYESLYS